MMSAKAAKADICRCPLFPQKRTFVAVIYMSTLCQKRTLIGAKNAYEVTYSITSSTIDNTPAGIVNPSAFAALRLSTNSNFVG